ncbi:MAG: thiamine pyrophosphate-binding protein [Endomicrobiaceae bacterium]|nr:thiamine pyrophosphate-binding protein [Endomicrobiaceae bacterium]MDD3922827.1 thiamine pyrophosphate-binding protein [Endomicrobiaceae bacterium]MDD5102723.1 thiamine pyrophosphate-binding protein [Endomicrobiaceae bacterium]
MIKLSDYVAKRLKEVYKINNIFMISGGGAMHLNDSFGKYIPYICNHHEQASAIAAEGYARVNQQLAVVSVTTGPGGLNCLNGVFGQWTDSVPVLYISGQVKDSTTISSCPKLKLRQLGDQEVDIISIVKPLTKYAVMLKEINDIAYVLDKAIYLATHGRKGPVWIDIPINLQAATIDESKLKKYDSKEDDFKLPNIDKQIDKLVNILKNSNRPLIIAGHGIRLANAKKEFLNLVNNLNIPVVTTMNGFDIIPNSNPNFMARIGTVANRTGNFILQNADCIISIGSRNNIRQVSYNWENFAKNAKLVAIDIDKAELEKPTIKPYLKINADAKDFITKFINKLKKIPIFSDWNNFCNSIKVKYPPISEAKRIAHNPIEPYFFIDELIKCFKDDEIVIGGNGTAFLLPFQVGKVKQNQRFIWNSGDASMGYDLPASIGACIATNRKRTICLAGDGSIMMNLQELQTIRNYNLPIKIFVLNNNGYISIQQTQQNFFNGRLTACSVCSGVTLPDFTKIGKAFNLKTVKINKITNLTKQINNVLKYDGPILCEVMLSPNYIFAPKLSAKKLKDGTMISPSLEDLYPFLDKKEFEENIIK